MYGQRHRSLLRIFYRICQKINHDLADTPLISQQYGRQAAVNIYIKCQFFFFHPHLEQIHNIRKQLFRPVPHRHKHHTSAFQL